MSDRYDLLQPPDIVAALRSMPRRFGAALFLPTPDRIAEYSSARDDDDLTPADHVGALLLLLDRLDEALRTTSADAGDPLDPAVSDAMANVGVAAGPSSPTAAAKQIERRTLAIANRLDAVAMKDWSNAAPLGSETVTVLDLGRGAVRVAAERLMRVERALQPDH